MRLLGVAGIFAIVGVLLVSSSVTPVGTIGPANAGLAPVADAKPAGARSRPVQRSARVLEDRDSGRRPQPRPPARDV